MTSYSLKPQHLDDAIYCYVGAERDEPVGLDTIASVADEPSSAVSHEKRQTDRELRIDESWFRRRNRGRKADIASYDRSSFVRTPITNGGTEAARDPAFAYGPGIVFDLREVAPILLEPPVLYSTSDRMRYPRPRRDYTLGSGWSGRVTSEGPRTKRYDNRTWDWCGTGRIGVGRETESYAPSPWIDTEFGVAIDRFAEFGSGDEREASLNPYLWRAERSRGLRTVVDGDRSLPARTVVRVPLAPDLIGICDVMAWMNGEAAVRYEPATERGRLAAISAGWRCVAAHLAAQLDAIGRNEVVARGYRSRRGSRRLSANNPWGPRDRRASR